MEYALITQLSAHRGRAKFILLKVFDIASNRINIYSIKTFKEKLYGKSRYAFAGG
jgi:hypothetical protein